MQPYCDINSKPTTNNVFVFGSTSVMNESSNKIGILIIFMIMKEKLVYWEYDYDRK